MNLILGIDIGTTNAKAILYDINGNIYNDYSESYPLYRDETGMAEQEPDDIVNSVIKMINQANTDTKKEDNRILAVSFSSANQSLILLDKNYQPLTRSITWADIRARKTALKLKTNKLSYTIFNNTGTPIHPMSPLVKLL